MATVTQQTYRPTNKLTAAMLGGVAYEFAEPVVAKGVELAGTAIDVPLALGPSGSTLLMFLTMFAAGYIVKDAPNV